MPYGEFKKTMKGLGYEVVDKHQDYPFHKDTFYLTHTKRDEADLDEIEQWGREVLRRQGKLADYNVEALHLSGNRKTAAVTFRQLGKKK